MANAFNIEILRSIKGSLGRFVAIAGIVALGTGFYAGLRMTAPDMNLAANDYYDQMQLMDVRVVGTLGITDVDVQSISQLENVEEVEPARETDVMALVENEQYAVRVHSLTNDVNKLELVSGHWPEAPNECVLLSNVVMRNELPPNAPLHITESTQPLEDTLTSGDYKVVGTVTSSYYVCSTSLGNTALGSGKVDQVMYVLPEAFKTDKPYTEVFIKVAGATEEQAGSDAYKARVQEVMDEITAIAPECEARRLAEIKDEAQQKLNDARAEYEREKEDAENELANAKAKLNDAAVTIAQSEADLAEGEDKYATGAAELEDKRAEANRQIANAERQIENAEKKLSASKKQLAAAEKQLEAGWQQAGIQPSQAAGTIQQLDQAISQLEKAAAAGVPGAEQQLATTKGQRAQLQTLVQSQAQYDSGKAEYNAGMQELAGAKHELESQRQNANQQIAEAEQKLNDASEELEEGRRKLADGRWEYNKGQADYNSAREEADQKFADAERELADAQDEVNKLDDLKNEWLVMDRTKNMGTVNFESDATRVDNIAQVFPFIFFLVAALVALTTMTRMVDEERVLIGTFKALGYSRARITSKYIIYAAVASGVGAAMGITALSLILPPVIMEAYAIIYYVPHNLIMPINPGIAALSATLGIGTTLFATWFAVAATLRETPAALMLPPAPKAGKRILLERIRPVWQHLSFSWKVTFRNLFRYKKRFIMTVIGIAGCTALLLTGLGLQDSINDIIDKQFGQTVHYNVVVTFDTQESAKDGTAEIESLCQTSTAAAEETIKAQSPNGKDYSATFVTPENAEEFQKLWVLRERVSGKELSLGPDSVIISEKLANVTGATVGGTIKLAKQDEMGNATNETFELTVSGIMENYIANYVFAGSQIYKQMFGENPAYTRIFGSTNDGVEAHDAFAKSARLVPGVKTVAFNNELIDTYRRMLRSVNMIVIVLVVAAAALAFIVLYNLTNINITERQREIATLKVLGFTPGEVDMYIYRETILLTIIGALFGLVLGVFMEGFVVVTAEVDYVMFGRDIHVLSFVIGFFLTLLFAILVMLAMRPKLARINMVESLKSNE